MLPMAGLFFSSKCDLGENQGYDVKEVVHGSIMHTCSLEGHLRQRGGKELLLWKVPCCLTGQTGNRLS